MFGMMVNEQNKYTKTKMAKSQTTKNKNNTQENTTRRKQKDNNLNGC